MVLLGRPGEAVTAPNLGDGAVVAVTAPNLQDGAVVGLGVAATAAVGVGFGVAELGGAAVPGTAAAELGGVVVGVAAQSVSDVVPAAEAVGVLAKRVPTPCRFPEPLASVTAALQEWLRACSTCASWANPVLLVGASAPKCVQKRSCACRGDS